MVSCDCNWWTVRIKSTNTVNPPIFNRHGHTLWIQGFIPDQYPPLHTLPRLLLLFRVNFFHCTRGGLLFNSGHTSLHDTSLDQLTTEALNKRFAFSASLVRSLDGFLTRFPCLTSHATSTRDANSTIGGHGELPSAPLHTYTHSLNRHPLSRRVQLNVTARDIQSKDADTTLLVSVGTCGLNGTSLHSTAERVIMGII